jgi:hypothetical protein
MLLLRLERPSFPLVMQQPLLLPTLQDPSSEVRTLLLHQTLLAVSLVELLLLLHLLLQPLLLGACLEEQPRPPQRQAACLAARPLQQQPQPHRRQVGYLATRKQALQHQPLAVCLAINLHRLLPRLVACSEPMPARRQALRQLHL